MWVDVFSLSCEDVTCDVMVRDVSGTNLALVIDA